ncbi:hypothetical protein BV22DRAFT_1135479 [Leucogyrophana mollusca]|uniref:Uncharacterized protein n=1 Tax=Leucogyrophana mollusca TaxID=85980 RepID=A0ACB8AWL7_9AGAM|nr:hypothetical protein BV22DRAFT_1135479 [Leucogyrophana mollusca]
MIVFDRRHVRPLAPNSIRKHNDAKRLWLAFFGRLLRPEGAEATLQKDAPLPPLAHVKKFFHFVATNTVSGLGLGKGWTNRTTTIFISRTFSMRACLGAIAPTADDRIQLNAAVSEWAVVDKSLTTAALAKRSIREVDLVEFLNATLKSSIRFANNLGRIQTGCFASLLYSTGQRPGGVIEAQEYQTSDQHLKWKHTEWLATGWDEGAGLAIQCFITFHFMKNMRNSDADFVVASTCSLGCSQIHLDSQLPLMALGIAAGVFKTDLLQLHELGPGNMPAQFPFAIKLHPNKASLPVFVSPADKASPWSYNGAQKATQMVARELGWQHFSLRSFRYAFAGAMSSVIPKGHLKYLMGHRYGSKLAMTTYQVPDRPIDMSGAWFSGEGNMTDITDWHSSVAYGRTEPTMTTETLEKDAAMNELLKELHTLEKVVFQEFGRFSSDVPEEHLDSPSVQATLTKWSDIMQHYADMEARGNRGVLPAEILSAHKRRSASVSSAGSSMSTTSDNLKHRPRQSRSTSIVSQTPSTPQPRSLSQSSASSAMSGVSAACRSVSTHQQSQSATSDASQQTAWHHRSASTSSLLSNMSDVIATAPPMSLPPRNAPFSDSVPQIDDETLMNDILETINSFGSTHAFLPVIDNEPENPRLAVLQRYLMLLKADDLKDAGVCMWCYSNETLGHLWFPRNRSY